MRAGWLTGGVVLKMAALEASRPTGPVCAGVVEPAKMVPPPMTVSYTNVVVTDTTNGISHSFPGTF